MAIAGNSEVWNHRGVTFQATGDGATTQFTIANHRFNRSNFTCSAFGVINPTSFDRPSGKGGLQHPAGTAVAISSCSVANGVCTVNTSAAVANGTVAYFTVVLDQDAN